MAKRFERPRPLIVVLEEKAAELRPAEDLLRDPIVAAGGVEHALVIAPADVDAEGQAGVSLDDRVVQLDRRVEHAIGIAAAGAVALADGLVEQPGILRGVNLDVLAAEARELGNLAAGEIHDVGKIGIERRVCPARLVRVVVGGRLLGAEEGHLDRLLRPAAQIGELLGAHLPAPPQLVDDDGAIETGLPAVPIAKRDRPAGSLVEPFERFDEVAVEGVAPHLAVGHDVEAGHLLQGDGFVHRPILDQLEFRRRQGTGVAGGAGVLQILGAEQAADDITLEQIHLEKPAELEDGLALRACSSGRCGTLMCR